MLFLFNQLPLPYAPLGYAKIQLVIGKEAMGENLKEEHYSERYLLGGDISRQ